MKRLMIINGEEFVKYRQGRSCVINVILPTERLDYMKIIMKTYIDMKKWNYYIVIEDDDDTTPVYSNLDEDWFRDCEYYVKCNLNINNLKIRS